MAEDYIPREAVIELLTQKQRDICPVGRCGHGYVYGRDRDEYDAIEADIDTVNNIPAADVRRVVHGHWVKADTPGLMKCSECGRYATHSEILEWDYCNCGADMRVKQHETS